MKKEMSISLDLIMTGQVLKHMIKKKGYTISEIQKELKLSCPQPIYRWMSGQTLPSLDHLYKLSALLKMHMEDLVIPRQDEVWILHRARNPYRNRRVVTYLRRMRYSM
ncbi:MAG: helix-turn-helix domain-containing protein [Lachnospiraceae bacterium]|nr:helix-turn-helix domain-containing protein [Lachnospiraceae bacterium]MDE7272461.1 helix-turn-helix domain-containing protein [Lachnospiraceae bacterium]